MTYFQFLGLFLVIPLILMLYLNWRDQRAGKLISPVLRTWPAWGAVLLHVFIAVAYTTPWDNYLVASGVWYYPPERVVGLKLGYVPIEEYTFFVLQSLLTGSWLLWLSRRLELPTATAPARVGLRVGVNLVLAAIVAWGVFELARGHAPATYAALILVWSLPPIMIQIAWGGHLLWHFRRLVFTSLVSVTFYLAAADFLAIGDGIWTIDPAQSYNVFLFGVLPLEEFIFFLVTNILLVFGMTLALSRPSLEQFARLRARLKARNTARS